MPHDLPQPNHFEEREMKAAVSMQSRRQNPEETCMLSEERWNAEQFSEFEREAQTSWREELPAANGRLAL